MVKRDFKRYIFIFYFLTLFSLSFAASVSENIVIDQIGYRTNSNKWFMIKNPIIGYDSSNTYVPGSTVQLRRSSDNAVMLSITLTAWNGGATDTTFSGDRVWQGQFSSFTTPGTYHIYDPTNNRQSYNFEIGDNIYNGALQAAVKMFFYNRSNITITASTGGTWTHVYDHPQQANALLYDYSLGGVQQGTQRDITKGWFDAGDPRKYTAWMAGCIWHLAYAYEWYPDRFGDNTGIPESGNGVPDILDEIKWELDWMLKMQRADGALYSGCFVVQGINGTVNADGNPAADDRPYFYANFSTGATASGAAAFAIGARLFAPYSGAYPGYSTQLQTAAINAWNFLTANPNNIQYNHTNFDNANANVNDGEDKRLRFLAAAELYRLTDNSTYRNYCDANYNNSNTADGSHQPIISNYFETGASHTMQKGLVSYAMAPGATSSVVDAIKTALRNGIEWNITSRIDNCPYKAHMWAGHYCWGSNSMKANWANMCLWGAKLNVNSSMTYTYLATAEEYLHYYFGRNATGYCYLTQSQLFGADKSITQIFHCWFSDGTIWDTNPAPGYLSGGPNQYYSVSSIIPPYGQPPMKSYRDWNSVWPDSSWEITEPSTGYQAAFVMLCAAFAGPAGPTATPTRTGTNTPYAGTPSFTPTRTRTQTNTPYYTPTITPTTPLSTLIYDGDTSGYRLSDGTVSNGSPGTMTEGAYGVTGNGMRLTYTSISGWWQEHRWDKTVNVNIGSNIYLVFNVRQAPISPNPVNQLFVRINWTNTIQVDPTYIVEGGSIDTTWKTVRIPLSVLVESGQTVIDFIGFAASWDRDYTVDIDNVRLEATLPTATNTPMATNTWTHTRTVTFTFSRTVTPTWTRTLTQTNTPSFSVSATGTRTATMTFTSSQTPTNSFTMTRTITGTPTWTNTLVSTATFTPSRTETITYTRTATMTITNSHTPSSSFTPTRTPTASVTITTTNTSSQQPTVSFTVTGTWTRTVTSTAT
ncbi:MAG: glycoside hydrolase family 9 protein, partial [Candidatus Goldbacteria bacterium]|nr:glycoside hydrolase family 9 protein [Candidatus Goldiibacteriota bacterium]